MEPPPRYRLNDAEKDALLLEQAALIERLAARVAELGSLVGKPRKTGSVSVVCRLPCGWAGRCGESWLSGRFDSVADLASWQASWFAPCGTCQRL
jgi:hypothetical protein